MDRVDDLPLPDEDLYNAELNWKPWVEYSLRKSTTFQVLVVSWRYISRMLQKIYLYILFQLEPVDSLIQECGLVVPIFTGKTDLSQKYRRSSPFLLGYP